MPILSTQPSVETQALEAASAAKLVVGLALSACPTPPGLPDAVAAPGSDQAPASIRKGLPESDRR